MSTYIAYIDPTQPTVNGHEFVFTDRAGILQEVLDSDSYVKVVRVDSVTVLKDEARRNV